MDQQVPVDDASLAAQLDNHLQDWTVSVPRERVQAYEEGIELLIDSGFAGRALHAGDRAPAFDLPDASGEVISLRELLTRGPVVLKWYRGAWCPYCNIELRFWQGEPLCQLQELGATLVAISPQTPDNSLTTVQKNALEFKVLSDIGNKVARDYGLVFKVPNSILEQMEGRIDLERYHGNRENELPVPATYLIDSTDLIRFAHIDPDYRKRAEPSDVVRTLNELRLEGK